MKKINIVVADDHHLVRDGIMRILKTFDRIGRVREASGGHELLRALQEQHAEVALIDINMPDLDGFSLSEKVIKLYPNVKVLVITMRDDDTSVARMLEIGVHGYLLKSTDVDELQSAIYSVVDYGHYHNALVFSVVKKIMQGKVLKLENSDRVKLTKREIEVLKLICEEYSYKEISDRLFISEKTIHNHRNRIMGKIGAKNTISLIKFAYLNDYLTWENNETL